MRLAAFAFATSVTLPCMLGCEPEIGGICDPDTDYVNELVEQVPGTNNLVLDVRLDNCTQGFCLSTDGSRPYCTKRCQANIECAEAGEGFVCEEVVVFGPLACDDYEDPNEPQEGSSGATCAGGAGCSDTAETCFEAPSEAADTCGIAGRDCLTGDGGAQSTQTFKYCKASSVQVIEDRDVQFGRTTE